MSEEKPTRDPFQPSRIASAVLVTAAGLAIIVPLGIWLTRLALGA